MAKRILIIEDDENILRLEHDYLNASGFEIDSAMNGSAGLKMALNNKYDLIILDIMLPEINGFEICQKIREEQNIPILLVSAKRDELDKIKGLGFGADDYIVKPFSPSELVARVLAHLNRYERLINANSSAIASTIIEIGPLKIDRTARRVEVNKTEIMLTNKEFDLLTCIAEEPDKIFSKDELFEKIWQYDPSIGETSTVTVHINRVREKIYAVDPQFPYLSTVWGKGYRFNK